MKRAKSSIDSLSGVAHRNKATRYDSEKINIGVVEGIVGINWWDVTIEGSANHAGTTAMNNRQDALLAAAKFIPGREPSRDECARASQVGDRRAEFNALNRARQT